jgi:hypothetical protein
MPLFNFSFRGGPKKSQKANKVLHDEIVDNVVAVTNTSPTELLEECTCGARKEMIEMKWEIKNFLRTLELNGNKNASVGNHARLQKVCKFESGKTVIYLIIRRRRRVSFKCFECYSHSLIFSTCSSAVQ